MTKSRRLVFLFAGFETNAAEEQRSRFAYAAKKTGEVWNTGFDVGPLSQGASGCPEFRVSARGDGWETETDIVVCDWSGLLDRFRERGIFARFFSGLWAQLSFTLNGTLFRYFCVSWRYGLFFLYPLVQIAVALAPLTFVSWSPGVAVFAVLACALLFWLLVRRLHLMTLLDNWSFARALALENDGDVSDKVALFAEALARRKNNAGDGEVVIAAHSLGAYFAVMALGQVLPELASRHASPGLLMAGSSLLKIALHPKAARLKNAVTVVAGSGAKWLEVQALTDALNFFRTDPVAVLGIASAQPPAIQFVRFRNMLFPQTYRRIKRDLLRMHRQYVLAVERRTSYSFHMIIAGPVSFGEIFQKGGLPADFVGTAQMKSGAV